jgi:hypothetical protein
METRGPAELYILLPDVVASGDQSDLLLGSSSLVVDRPNLVTGPHTFLLASSGLLDVDGSSLLAEESIGYFHTPSAQRVSRALPGPQLQRFPQTDIRSPGIQIGHQRIGGAGCPSSMAPDEVQTDCYAGLMATLGDCCECIKSLKLERGFNPCKC